MTLYEELLRDFRWSIPATLNLGSSICTGGVAGRDAEALAVSNEGRVIATYSFGYLHEYSNRMANYLHAAGHRRGDVIGVMLPQSLEAAVAILAILKAGMVCMPLVPDKDSNAFVDRLRVARAAGLVTTRQTLEQHAGKLADILPAGALHGVLEEGGGQSPAHIEALLAMASPAFQPAETKATDPAFLSFTSGSEGAPKGVLHGHQLVSGIAPTFHFTGIPGPGDRSWSHFEWGWLGGLMVVMGNWSFGASTVVARQAQPISPAILRMLEACDVTRASISPTALRMLKLGSRKARFPSLRSVSTGGEKLDPATYRWARDHFGAGFSELYGLTECSGVLGSGHLIETREDALGRPVPGQDVRIIDAQGNCREVGEAGTIAVRGPHPAMFLGYLDDEAATRQRFAGEYLRTGDSGFIDEDGYFHIAGREDDLILVGGRRIGPGEIETAVAALPGIRACAVAGVPDELAGQRLVCWVEADNGQAAPEVLESQWLAALRAKLPSYQVPQHIRIVPQLPMTSNGKVSRRLVREAEAGPSQ